MASVVRYSIWITPTWTHKPDAVFIVHDHDILLFWQIYAVRSQTICINNFYNKNNVHHCCGVLWITMAARECKLTCIMHVHIGQCESGFRLMYETAGDSATLTCCTRSHLQGSTNILGSFCRSFRRPWQRVTCHKVRMLGWRQAILVRNQEQHNQQSDHSGFKSLEKPVSRLSERGQMTRKCCSLAATLLQDPTRAVRLMRATCLPWMHSHRFLPLCLASRLQTWTILPM